LLDELGCERLDVRAVGYLRVGHDRRGVRVDEHHFEAGATQRLAGLRSRVVELGCLTDDDRAGTEYEDLVDVIASGHLYPAECITWVAAAWLADWLPAQQSVGRWQHVPVDGYDLREP